ncbi:MAG: helicase-exonuclease AddAB subunit AddA [Ruminococcus sp.]|nr:helicase-exonuclease AddAB subunit AddA [Ruminococcus sp.]
MPVWTEDQLKAINTQDKGVIVSAAAGSGKTAVLVERTIRMLCDEEKKVEADKLLAVTFTNDAASQMKEKLSAALDKKLRENPENTWISSQQQKLALAQITTINSFCYDFVRNHIHEFDFDSSVSICDENDDRTIFDTALTQTMEELYDKLPVDMAFLNEYLAGETDKEITQALTDLNRFFESIPFKDEWIEKQRERYSSEDFFAEIADKTKQKIISEIRFLLLQLEKLKGKAERLEYTSAPLMTIESDIARISSLLDLGESVSIDKLYESMKAVKFDRFSGLRRKKNETYDAAFVLEEAACEAIKNTRSDISKQFNKLTGQIVATGEQTKRDISVCKMLFETLIRAEDALCRNIHDAKVQRNVVSFSDVEHMAVELLLFDRKTRTSLCEEIVKNNDYKVILIDEFQDVNNMQDLIFKAISNTEDLNVIGSNVFVVGDMKQSIYSFRLSNPRLFDKMKKDAAWQENVEQIDLMKNFRSRSCIINSINYFFEKLMTTDMGEIDYSDEREQLVTGAGYDKQNDSPVEVDIICEEEKLPSYYGFDNEQLAIAKRILELLKSGATVEEDGEKRPCRAGDFCILTRGRSAHKGLSKALKFVGINSTYDASDGYLKSREISVILNLLKVLDNPLSDIPLLSVMLSPIMMFTPDDVSMIRSIDKEKKLYQNLCSFVCTYEEMWEDSTPLFSNPLIEKAQNAVNLIKELRFMSASMSTERLIRKIYLKTNYYAIASTYKDAGSWDNLTLLLRYASAFDSNSAKGLSGFLRYLDSVSENGNDFKTMQVASSDNDSVIITTMHSSKGLEYPFVFLSDLDKKMNIDDVKSKMIVNERMGISFRYNDNELHTRSTPLHYAYLKEQYIDESISEEIRILYVAMTRAKERLFLPIYLNEQNRKKLQSLAASLSNTGVVCTELLKSTDGMFRWIVLPLLAHEQMNSLRAESEVDFDSFEFSSGGSFTEKVIYCDKEPEKSDEVRLLERSQEYTESFDFSSSYDDRLSKTPAKLSVSEVVKEDKEFVFYPQIPKFTEEIGKYTAAERGTITHSFMEICDFSSAANDLDGELERLVNSGKLSPRRAESIDRRAVSAFFESDIYKRLSKSENVMREQQFLVKISDIKVNGIDMSEYDNTDGMLQGVADCIFEEKDGYVLVDYKTDRVKSEDDLRENYKNQLLLYKSAFDIILDKPIIGAYIYSFVLAKGIEISF